MVSFKWKKRFAAATASIMMLSATSPIVTFAQTDNDPPIEQQEVAPQPIGIEVRGLDGTRTQDVNVTVSDVNGTVFVGSYTEYSQWLTDEALPVGTYTISLATPEGTTAVANDSVNNYALPTGTPNVFTLDITEDNLAANAPIYGTFSLVEDTEQPDPEPIPETYTLGVEVRGLDGTRTDTVEIYVSGANGNQFSGSYNEYLQWLSNEELPAGSYTIELVTPEGTVAEVNNNTVQYATPTETPNVFTIELNEETFGSNSAIYGAFNLVETAEEVAPITLGVEVRGLDGTRTDEASVTVTGPDGTLYEGAFNENLQWLTDEQLPEGTYTIELTTPEGTLAQINDTTNQFAVPTDTPNVFTIEVNEANLGSSSALYGAFNLVEVEAPVPSEYTLGVEVRGLDDTRTDEAGVTVTDADGNEFAGSYNEYLQWLTDEQLPEGAYTIELTTPEGTVAQINDTTNQFAVPTDTPNVFTIELNEDNLGSSSAIYGAFSLVEEDAPISGEYTLGVEVRGLDDTRTDEAGVTVTDADGNEFTGSYNEYLQWLTDEQLPEGTYTIELTTPEGTIAQINDTTNQFAVPTDTPNVFTIELNEDNLGSSSAIYGAFSLVEEDAPISGEYTLGVEVRGLDDTRTDEAGVTVTDADGNEFTGSYNEYLQWLTDEQLPEGTYTIELTTPEGTVAQINDTTNQFAVPTDTPNVFTIELNEDNLGSSSAIYGAFSLVEEDAPISGEYTLGVEVRGLDDTRTDEAGVTVTDADGNEFPGSYNEYLQWLTDEQLPEGTYTIELTTPEGTVAQINDTTNQFAVPTDTPNVFTIELNEDNLGSSSAIYGAFSLVESDVTDPVPDDNGETPDQDTENPEASSPDQDTEGLLPATGESSTWIITGLAVLLLVGGIIFIFGRRRSE